MGFLFGVLIAAYIILLALLGYHAADAGLAGEWDKGSFFLLWLVVLGVGASNRS